MKKNVGPSGKTQPVHELAGVPGRTCPICMSSNYTNGKCRDCGYHYKSQTKITKQTNLFVRDTPSSVLTDSAKKRERSINRGGR